MNSEDQISRFTIDDTGVRGQLVSLDNSWRQCVDLADASPFATQLLGQALSAVSLLAATIKIDGNITLQIRGSGAIHLLVAQATSKQTIRGLVRQGKRVADEQAPLSEIFASDKMVITIDTGGGKTHQGIVPLTGNSLPQALETYFEQSEQLPTRLWLASNDQTTSGLLLQKLPGNAEDEDGWNRITQLASTITEQELITLDQQQVLHRLFHEEVLRIFDPQPMSFACGCSTERTSNMIKSLGRKEAIDIIREQGTIRISCEFCNAQYEFDAIDTEQLFKAEPDLPSSRTIH